MHDRIITPPLPNVPITDDPRSSKHDVLQWVGGAFTVIIDWLRAGYPDEAPRTGYSPLLALNGPLALTSGQKDRVAQALGGLPTDTTNVEVAITKATNRLPTPAQTSSISRELHLRTSPQ